MMDFLGRPQEPDFSTAQITKLDNGFLLVTKRVDEGETHAHIHDTLVYASFDQLIEELRRVMRW